MSELHIKIRVNVFYHSRIARIQLLKKKATLAKECDKLLMYIYVFY